MPCRRQSSAVAIPVSCFLTIAMICSSEKLFHFIRPSPSETEATQNGANSGVLGAVELSEVEEVEMVIHIRCSISRGPITCHLKNLPNNPAHSSDGVKMR
jgi:hypothetical protein